LGDQWLERQSVDERQAADFACGKLGVEELSALDRELGLLQLRAGRRSE
jgi:hypothetical protein